jgi:hypothetical protein
MLTKIFKNPVFSAAPVLMVLTTATGAMFGYESRLLPSVSAGDLAGAIASILGGIIGAAGAALAVYLTIAGQRKDDTEKVEAALRMEVAEFGRLALGPLFFFAQRIIVAGDQIPLNDLPALVAMPEAVVYKATADRISRLPYGTLFVTFHSRIAEAISMAKAYATSGRPVQHEGRSPTEPMIEARLANTLATGWRDICELACTIMRADAAAPQSAEASIASILGDLDSALALSAAILSPLESGTTEAGTRRGK